VSRVAPIIGVGSIQNGVFNLVPQLLTNPVLRSILAFGGNGGSSSSGGVLTTGQGDRCPGSMERGGVYYPESGYPCNPNQTPTGP